MKKYVNCIYCDGLGYNAGPMGPRTCLICDGVKFIPAKKNYAKNKLDNISHTKNKNYSPTA